MQQDEPPGRHPPPMSNDDDDESYGRGDEAEDSDDSDIDRLAYGVHQALPVDDRPPDFGAPPADAEEYLRRVRHEAKHLPRVMTSAVNPRAYDDLRSRVQVPKAVAARLPEAPDFARPRAEWIREFLCDFDDVRDELQCDDDNGSRDGAAHGGGGATTRTLEGLLANAGIVERKGEVAVAQLPMDSFLRSLDQVKTTRFLRQRINNVRSAGRLSHDDAVWLFGLLARLERPVDADICASLQALHRQLVRLRASLPGPEAPELPWANMLIVITGACFGQDEQLAPLYDD